MTKNEYIRESKRLSAREAHWNAIKICAEENVQEAILALRHVHAKQAGLYANYAPRKVEPPTRA